MGSVVIDIDETVYVDDRDILHQLDEECLIEELDRRKVGRVLKEHERVKFLIGNQFTTEEVEEIYECIIESYHYDVFMHRIEELK